MYQNKLRFIQTLLSNGNIQRFSSEYNTISKTEIMNEDRLWKLNVLICDPYFSVIFCMTIEENIYLFLLYLRYITGYSLGWFTRPVNRTWVSGPCLWTRCMSNGWSAINSFAGTGSITDLIPTITPSFNFV